MIILVILGKFLESYNYNKVNNTLQYESKFSPEAHIVLWLMSITLCSYWEYVESLCKIGKHKINLAFIYFFAFFLCETCQFCISTNKMNWLCLNFFGINIFFFLI